LLERYENEQRHLSEMREQNNTSIAALNDEDKRIQDIITQTEEALERLYQKDIIYIKYREFVVITSFYEYIASERCDSLGGRDGAYNLYEMELREGIKIRQNEIALQQLNDIRNTQIVYCNIMEESLRISREIASEMSRLNHHTASIGIQAAETAKATKLSAYYAAETARNSKILVDLNRGDFDSLVTQGGRHIIG
jgi:hypothetical protein